MAALVATLVVIGTLALILTDKLNYTIAAVAGAAVMIGIGISMGFYSQELAIEAIEFEALGLLLGIDDPGFNPRTKRLFSICSHKGRSVIPG